MKTASTLQTRLLKEICFKILIGCLSGLLLAPLLFILFYIVSKGFVALNWDFFTQLPKPVGMTGGGVANAIVGSLILVGVAAIVSVPFGVMVGLYLSENQAGRFSEVVRLCVDTLQGVPSIVMGIIAYTWIVLPMGSFSALSGGLALAFMMVPLITKSTEETLKLIPNSLKEASIALGVPYHTTLLKVILPAGRSGIMSGVLLGLARVSGETAPLLFTAFGNPFMSTSLFKSVNALPLIIFNYATSPYQDWQTIAWGASLLLVAFVLGLSILSKVVIKK